MSSSLTSAASLAENEAPAGAVLLIEDEEYIAHLLEIVFRRAGFGFLWARNGAEASRLMTENTDKVALALVDWGLPDTSGGQLSRRLRHALPGLPLLLTSGEYWEPDAELDTSGPTLFVAKPFLPSRLVEHVHTLLRSAA